MEPFAPLLTTHDWNEEWKTLQKLRRRVDDASYWDKRSATFSTKDAPNPYVERFLELAAIRPGETVFDMGCGTGALSVPLGQAGHNVIAADFSQGMLDRMGEQLADLGVRTVSSRRMSWEDDWSAFGVEPGAADVALASRSIATADMRESLLRLTDTARRRVCVTLSTGASPRTDERLLADIGLDQVRGHDYLYAFNILANEGFKPELSYIESAREDTFDSYEDAYEAFARMVNDAATGLVDDDARENALERLRAWTKDNLVENGLSGQPDKKGVAQGRLRLRQPRTVTWAFLAWNK